MQPNPLPTATDAIRALVNRKANRLSWLEATFSVTEAMSEADATQVLDELIAQHFLARGDADLALMLAQRLGVAIQWRHARFDGDGQWVEGRGA